MTVVLSVMQVVPVESATRGEVQADTHIPFC